MVVASALLTHPVHGSIYFTIQFVAVPKHGGAWHGLVQMLVMHAYGGDHPFIATV